jgi:uncharacterized protein (DUF736 family)
MSDWTKLGAFWKKKSKNGKTFLSGVIKIDDKETKITCWPNDKNGNEKRPDFNIYLDDYKPAAKSDDQDTWPGDENDHETESDVPF